MKTLKTKILVTALASLPLVAVYADATASGVTPTGAIAHVSELSVADTTAFAFTPGTISNPDGTIVNQVYTLSFSDNSMFGYVISMKSSNAGLEADTIATPGSPQDGEFIDLKWNCAALSTSSGTIPDTSDTTLAADVNPTSTSEYNTLITVSNPDKATSGASSACTASLVNSLGLAEAVVEPDGSTNFQSTFTFKITTTDA